MPTLDEVYASAIQGEVILRTLELSCPAWPDRIAICNGFTDSTCRTEDGRDVLFIAANIDIALAKKNNKGNQTLAFAIDNTSGEAQRKIDLALDADARVTATYRTYLFSNLLSPAERPYTLTIMGGTMQSNQAQLQCGFFDLIGVAWPRDLYTTNFVPGLKYL